MAEQLKLNILIALIILSALLFFILSMYLGIKEKDKVYNGTFVLAEGVQSEYGHLY